MSKFKDFFKKIMPSEEAEDYDDYDDYQGFDENGDEESVKPRKKRSYADDFDDDDEDDLYSNSGKKTDSMRPVNAYTGDKKVVGSTGAGLSGGLGNEVCMITPQNYEDAKTIADLLLKNKAVILNLENNDMASAQRLIDFAGGACYTVGGSLQKVSKKIFIIVPESMSLGGDFEHLLGDMFDLNSVNMLK